MERNEKCQEVRPDMDQAIGDLRELNTLSARFGFDLVGCIQRLTECDAPVFCCEIDPLPAEGADYLLAKFKLHERLDGALAALRARNSDFDTLHAPTDSIIAMQNAFRRWWGKNSGALEDGDVGDIQELFTSLKSAAAMNASNSSSEKPSAF
jgi:hypothetical protein